MRIVFYIIVLLALFISYNDFYNCDYYQWRIPGTSQKSPIYKEKLKKEKNY